MSLFCSQLANAHVFEVSAYEVRTDVLKIGHFACLKTEEKIRKLTNFVEAGDNVAEVNPGRPSFCHLVEQVIPEKL